MALTLIIIPADTAKPIELREADTELATLQAIVGGYIELVPDWHEHEGRSCDVFCNERGRPEGLPVNARATDGWLKALEGKGPLRYAPVLYGDVVITPPTDEEDA